MLLPEGQMKSAKKPRASLDASPLNRIESEVVGLFIQICRVMGLPRSVGEIHGLLFISAKPMAMDDLIERLRISKGSAGQGLKFLRDAGAIQLVCVPTDRRMHYEAVTQLRKLVSRFLSGRIIPHLDTSLSRLERLSGLARELPAAERGRVGARVSMLRSWQEQNRRFLPLVLELLGGKAVRT